MNGRIFSSSMAATALVVWMALGAPVAHAQSTPLTCSAQNTSVVLASLMMTVSRDTPIGQPISVTQNHLGSVISCRGGVAGTRIQVQASFPAVRNPRPNPYGPGILIDSNVAGVGYVVETGPSVMNTPEAIQIDVARTALAFQSLGSVTLPRIHAVKTGDIDLTRDHAVHDIEVLNIAWRAPGVLDGWQDATSFRYSMLPNGVHNLIAKTCYFGPTAGIAELRTERLGTISSGNFSGVGSEAAYGSVNGTLMLTCRNFQGGYLRVESSLARPGMEGVLDSRTGPGMATGVGIQVRHGLSGEPWKINDRWRVDGAGEVVATHYYEYAARYIQTAPAITPGEVETYLTLTMTYD